MLLRYGSAEQQARWLVPLLDGRMRSCFAMTEPEVASSDATNIAAALRAEPPGAGPGGWRLSGRKHWISGACDPRCGLAIVMCKSAGDEAPPHKRQSMVLVPMPSAGLSVVRHLSVYGYDDAPHGHAEILFADVAVPPTEGLLLGQGRGFEIAQGRLGPGRLHHCMRLLGAGRRALDMAAHRAQGRTVFGGPLSRQGGFAQSLARAALALEQARLLTLHAAAALDGGGNKAAAAAIAMAKVAAPAAALQCIDFAVQVRLSAAPPPRPPLSAAGAGSGTCRTGLTPPLRPRRAVRRRRAGPASDARALWAAGPPPQSALAGPPPQFAAEGLQVHGAAGVGPDTLLPYLWAAARTLRIADGPDEVHLASIAKAQLALRTPRL